MENKKPAVKFSAASFKLEALIEKVMEFGKKNSKVLIASGGTVLAVLLLVGVLNFINTSRETAAVKEYDIAMLNIQMLPSLTNQSEIQKVYEEQITRLQRVVQSYPGTVSAVRARLFLGRVYLDQSLQSQAGNQGRQFIDAAATYYNDALKNSRNDYYRALATLGLAQAYEMQDSKQGWEQAYTLYGNIVNRYSKEGFTPTALIGMARMKEMLGDMTNAYIYYKRVADNYTNSLWARYAKGKIYYPVVEGVNRSDTAAPQNTAGPTNLPFLVQ